MKKKIISAALSFLMLFGSAAALPQSVFTESASIMASAETKGDYVYYDNENGDGGVYVSRYNGNAANLKIPSTIGGKKVTRIFNSAFSDCKTLKSVTIPNTVKKIDDYAFKNCENLSNISIPSSVTSFGANIFLKTKWIDIQQKKNPFVVINGILINGDACKGNITIPSSVKIIGKYAFSHNRNLTGVAIPNSVKKINDSAFSGCENLSSVSVSNSVTYIGPYAFSGTAWIEAQQKKSPIVVINGILIDGNKCKGNVIIPSSVKSIGDYAFNWCRDITSVTISNGVKSIGVQAFYSCLNLTSVTIPNSVISIDDSAFGDCPNLKRVTVPSSVKKIGDKALGYYLDIDYENKRMDLKKVSNYTIYGIKGSASEKYAKENGFTFVEYIKRFPGKNRYATAAEISKNSFKTANTVVLAYGLNYADALAGVPLAKKLNAPILLTNKDTIPAETLTEIKRLKATKVYVLGGAGAISDKVVKTLKNSGVKTVVRYAGTTRFGTAVSIAKNLSSAPSEVFFVYAFNYADALSVSTVAATKGAPIIYLKTNGDIDTETAKYLTSIKSSVKNAYVIGGSGVISDAMMKKAGNLLGLTFNKTITRVAGKDRYATCVAVNKKFASTLTGTAICVAKGLDFPDALAGGVFAAMKKAPLFLVDNALKDVQTAYLKTKQADTTYVFGGTGAVPDKLVSEITIASK